MKNDPRLRDLASIAAMINETKLAELAKAQEEKANVERAIKALGDQLPTLSAAVPEAMAFVVHETWKAQRRRILNQKLAQKTANWLLAREEAQRAFGRAEVLSKLSSQSKV